MADDHESLLSFLENTFIGLSNSFLPDGKDADLRDIDRSYIKNGGCFYVVDHDGEVGGCVGVRRFSGEIAELKRLYLAKECRGFGLGRELCISAINDAREFGYKFLRLDTTKKLQAAYALFKKLGFYEISRYNSDSFAEIFMEKVL
jgi:N-acetylglutamate synthase-like GNAT family acetyltransferase